MPTNERRPPPNGGPRRSFTRSAIVSRAFAASHWAISSSSRSWRIFSRDLPSLKTFVTLSPAPGFGRWLKRIADDPAEAALEGLNTAPLALLDNPNWHQDPTVVEQLRPLLMRLAAAYYLRVKTKNGQPLNSVARFHLGNGARLERLNWLGDTSAKGVREAAGLMVNYLYDLNTIEANHESYANQGTVAASPDIHRKLGKLAPRAAREDRHV